MQESTIIAQTLEEESPYAVEMRAVSKAWPGVVANDHVNLLVRKGEIYAWSARTARGKRRS